MATQLDLVKDRVTERPNGVLINGVPATIERDNGIVIEPGTPLNAALFNSIIEALDGKLAKANLANNLTTTTPGQYALDAAQGKALNDAIPTEAVPLSMIRGGTGARDLPGLAQTLHPTQFPQPGWLLTLGPTGYAGGAGITAMVELRAALNLQSGAGTYIQSGLTFISLTANVTGSLAVYFPVPFPGQPHVVVTPNTDSLGTRFAAALVPDQNGFTLTARAETSYAMPVFWVAVYQP